MEFNIVVLAGRLAVTPDPPRHEMPGRLVLAVRSSEPQARTDAIPINLYAGQLPPAVELGDSVWVVGSLQRRINDVTGRSRLEVVARHIQPIQPSPEPVSPGAC